MNKFLSNKKLIIVMLTLIIVFGMISASITLRNNRQTPVFIQRFGNDALSVANKIVSVPMSGIRATSQNISALFVAFQENQHLKSQVDQVAQIEAQNQTLKQENRALKKQLKLTATLTDYHTVNAAVINRSPVNWQNIVTINRGSNAGLKKNMPVMAGSGLIGRLIEVNDTSAKVELLSTDNTASNRFAAEISVSGSKNVNGIISGFDASTGELIMTQPTSTSKIKKGQRVVTSGLGGVTPEGLFIGRVATLKKDDFGISSAVYIKPATDMDNFSVVTVILRTVQGD